MLNVSKPPLRSYSRLLNRLGWSLVLFFILFFFMNKVVESVFVNVAPTPTARAWYGLLTSVAYAVPFLLSGLIFSIMSKREEGKQGDSLACPQPRRDRILLPPAFPLLVLAGLGLNLIASELNYYICRFIGYIPESSADVYYDAPGAVILYMASAVAPAFAEEYLFRGVVYGNLRPYGKWQAVLISAMTFSLMHQNPAQLIYTFVCGVVMAFMYEWTGSMWCGVIFHLFNNEIGVIAESLMYGSYGESAYDLISLWNMSILLLGVISAAILAIYAVRYKKEQKNTPKGIFGRQIPDDRPVAEMWDAPMEGRNVRFGIRSAGMMTFIISSVAVILLKYLAVLAMNA